MYSVIPKGEAGLQGKPGPHGVVGPKGSKVREASSLNGGGLEENFAFWVHDSAVTLR